jgi:outer membrane protein assembly factor BamE (lipoprotein component of BamABCDE complex)
MAASAVGPRAVVAASLSAMLSGCMPIPYVVPPLGYTPDSRHNVSEAVPTFIVQGQTSREDVLYKLGEPDSVDGAGQTFVYVSADRHGGGGVLVMSYITNSMPTFTGQRTLFRRLTVEFDAAGVVSSATSETKTCTIDTHSRGLVETEQEAPVSVRSSWQCSRPPGVQRLHE